MPAKRGGHSTLIRIKQAECKAAIAANMALNSFRKSAR